MRLAVGVLLGFVIVAAAAGLLAWSGAFNVAASSPPGRFERSLATYVLNRSVAKRAPTSRNPFTSSPEVLRAGLAGYRENCVACHGAPGVDASEVGDGLNPPAPDLTLPRVQARTDGELFWIVSNGIRMTGMPAFGPSDKPEEIWHLVAFLRHLPELSNEEQAALKPAGEEKERHQEEGKAAPSTVREAGKAGLPEAKPEPAHAAGKKPHDD